MTGRRLPLEAVPYLARRGAAVKARIRRLNPEGIEEGTIPYGWNPHPRIWEWVVCAVGVRRFIRDHGRAAYRALPAEAFHRQGHRKAIRVSYLARAGIG